MKPEKDYLIQVLKPVVKSAGAQDYIRQAKTNPWYRQDNAIHLSRAVPGYDVVAELTQDGRGLNVYGETDGSRVYFATIALKDFEEPKSKPVTKTTTTTKKPAPKTTKKVAPVKAKTTKSKTVGGKTK